MKIDTSSIENYENMTAEEKVAALEGFEYEDNSSKLEDYKKLIDKASHEASEYKKKWQEAEKRENDNSTANSSEIEDLKRTIAELQRTEAISKNTAKFLAQKGFDEKLAAETAEAQVDGDTDKVFENLKKAQERFEKDLKAELMQNTPRQKGAEGSGNGNGGMTLEKFRKLSVGERVKFSQEHKDEYLKLYGGTE